MQYSSHILSHIIVACIYTDISQLNLYQHYVINNQACLFIGHTPTKTY